MTRCFRTVLAAAAVAVVVFAITGYHADAQGDELQPATPQGGQDDESQAGAPPVEFTHPAIGEIVSRQGKPIVPIVLPLATGGVGRLSYSISTSTLSTSGVSRKDGPPAGLVFDETTRRLSGRPAGAPGWTGIEYTVSDMAGHGTTISTHLTINSPARQGLPPAITEPDLGTLDRGLIRCGTWSKEGLRAIFVGISGYRWFEAYTFRLTSSSQLTIDLESEEADTTLSLAFPNNVSDPRYESESWHDEDSGQGTNSRLTLDLAPGTYTLRVSTLTLEKESVPYTLRIRSPDFTAGNADANRNCPEDSITIGRIVARALADGRIEFAWQVEDGERVLPRLRYLPMTPPAGRWLRSSDIVVEGATIGRINVRVDAETGRIEFAFTPTGGERILPPSRYFPSDAAPGRWLRSTLIEPGG